jgi:hypothetical protein
LAIAEIKGKISKYGTNLSDRLEDKLTSDVFSIFRYLDPNKLFRIFLEKSINVNEKEFIINNEIEEIEFIFWRKFNRSEPDVVVEYKANNTKFCIFFENKYMSGKSSNILLEEEILIAETPSDQIAREYFDMAENYPNCEKKLVYLTCHRTIPKQALNDSINEIEKISKKEALSNIFWNTWYHLLPIIDGLDDNELNTYERIMINDLKDLLIKKGLYSFNGISISVVRKIKYNYEVKARKTYIDTDYNIKLVLLECINCWYKNRKKMIQEYLWNLKEDDIINDFYGQE